MHDMMNEAEEDEDEDEDENEEEEEEEEKGDTLENGDEALTVIPQRRDEICTPVYLRVHSATVLLEQAARCTELQRVRYDGQCVLRRAAWLYLSRSRENMSVAFEK
uniref:Uncharacterized protein n=1 Tax=Vespula pensylvanica TaxID=30213 RepID=A0A834KCG8_VESPE|nr:hypothetical protein H0235_014831 [Vespula pensylvanica]